MKKYLCTIGIIILMLITVLFNVWAEDFPEEQITLNEFMNVVADGTETVSFYLEAESYEIDADAFFEISENIMLTDIEDRMFSADNTTSMFDGVLFITIQKDNQMGSYAAVSKFGEVDRYGMFMSRLPCADFEMRLEDLQKLYALLPVEAKEKLPDFSESSKTDLKGEIRGENAVINPNFTAGNSNYIVITLIAVAALVVIIVIVKSISFKSKK